MEFIIMLGVIFLTYWLINKLTKLLYKLQNPPFDAEVYNEAVLNTLEEYSGDKSTERLENLKKANKTLKERKEVRKAIENELNIKM